MPCDQGSEDHCVLVVEDEAGVRETLIDLIEMAGCTAIGAANGAEGMQILSVRLPCLIFLDLLMPVMGGLAMLEAMKREPALAAVPVVISTSAPERAPPGFPVIPKPVDVNAVWSWMRRSCSRAQTMPTVA